MKRLPPFDKYELYRRAVQDPEATADFLWNVHRDVSRRVPYVLREDFCGTFALCAEWVQRDPRNRAAGIDTDAAPLAYGKKSYLASLSPDARRRLTVRRGDVLKCRLPRADVACALNFSYFVFHDRARLKAYFSRCLDSLNPKGTLVLDVLPGTETTRQLVDEVPRPGYTYFWEQARFDPISRRVLYHMHFQRPGEKRRERVFVYDWRLWTVPELRELLAEVGFEKTFVYWEGRQSLGDAESQGSVDHCEAWVAFIVARK